MPVLFWVLMALQSCTNPTDIETPRHVTHINIDSLVSTGPFVGAPGDTISHGSTQRMWCLPPKLPGRSSIIARHRTAIISPCRRRATGSTIPATKSSRSVSMAFATQASMPSTPHTLRRSSSIARHATLWRIVRTMGQQRLPAGIPNWPPQNRGNIHVVKLDKERQVIVGTFFLHRVLRRAGFFP